MYREFVIQVLLTLRVEEKNITTFIFFTKTNNKQFQRRRFFRNRPIRNKNCMWWPCLLTNPDEMSNLHRGHSIDVSLDASYQITVHLGKRFQRRRFFRYQPIRNKHCLWWPCMSTDQNEISNNYGRSSIKNAHFVPIG
jgi:hypothetical protein